MSDECPVRVALRVDEVVAAVGLYRSMGFESVGAVPGPSGASVMAILRRGPLRLLVDALVGMPFPDSARERRTRGWPRGLGMVVGIEVDDVDEAAERCRAEGCAIGVGPVDAPWGERYVEFEDPYGYAWKLFRPLPHVSGDGLRVAADAWFGGRARPSGRTAAYRPRRVAVHEPLADREVRTSAAPVAVGGRVQVAGGDRCGCLPGEARSTFRGRGAGESGPSPARPGATVRQRPGPP